MDPLGEHFAAIVLELAPDGIAVTDEAGRIMQANTHFEYLFGFTREQLIGRSVEMLLPERSQAAHRAHRAGYDQAPSARAMGTGLDLWARHADGTEFPVEVGLSPVSSANGMRTIMSVRQISDRRASQQVASDEAVHIDEDRIAVALNDQVIRPIFAAGLDLHGMLASATDSQAARLNAIITKLDDAIREIRTIVYQSRPTPPPPRRRPAHHHPDRRPCSDSHDLAPGRRNQRERHSSHRPLNRPGTTPTPVAPPTRFKISRPPTPDPRLGGALCGRREAAGRRARHQETVGVPARSRGVWPVLGPHRTGPRSVGWVAQLGRT